MAQEQSVGRVVVSVEVGGWTFGVTLEAGALAVRVDADVLARAIATLAPSGAVQKAITELAGEPGWSSREVDGAWRLVRDDAAMVLAAVGGAAVARRVPELLRAFVEAERSVAVFAAAVRGVPLARARAMVAPAAATQETTTPQVDHLLRHTKEEIVAAIEATGYHMGHAAERLGMTRRQFYRDCKTLGVTLKRAAVRKAREAKGSTRAAPTLPAARKDNA